MSQSTLNWADHLGAYNKSDSKRPYTKGCMSKDAKAHANCPEQLVLYMIVLCIPDLLRGKR